MNIHPPSPSPYTPVAPRPIRRYPEHVEAQPPLRKPPHVGDAATSQYVQQTWGHAASYDQFYNHYGNNSPGSFEGASTQTRPLQGYPGQSASMEINSSLHNLHGFQTPPSRPTWDSPVEAPSSSPLLPEVDEVTVLDLLTKLPYEKRKQLLEHFHSGASPKNKTWLCNPNDENNLKHLAEQFLDLIECDVLLPEDRCSDRPTVTKRIIFNLFTLCAEQGIFTPKDVVQWVYGLPTSFCSEFWKPPEDLIPDEVNKIKPPQERAKKFSELNKEMVRRIIQLQTTNSKDLWLREYVKPLPMVPNERDTYFEVLRKHLRLNLDKFEREKLGEFLSAKAPPEFRPKHTISSFFNNREESRNEPSHSVSSQAVVPESTRRTSTSLSFNSPPPKKQKTKEDTEMVLKSVLESNLSPRSTRVQIQTALANIQAASPKSKGAPPASTKQSQWAAADRSENFLSYTCDQLGTDISSFTSLFSDGKSVPCGTALRQQKPFRNSDGPQFKAAQLKFMHALSRLGVMNGMDQSSAIWSHFSAAVGSLGVQISVNRIEELKALVARTLALKHSVSSEAE